MSVNEKVDLATKLIDGKLPIFKDRFKKIYPFTTENISGYMPIINPKNKRVLTVGSSGDQAINLSLSGCSDITILDICPFTKEYFYLKSAAIQTLSKEEYEKFLMQYGIFLNIFENPNVFSKKTFDLIKDKIHELDPDSLYFWEQLLSKRNQHQVRKKLFVDDEYKRRTIRRINPYLQSDESFEKTKERLSSSTIKFHQEDITKTELSSTYDSIILSNIPCNYPIVQTREVVDRLLNNLEDDGTILISYLYSLTPDLDFYDGEAEIYNIALAKKNLPSGTELIRFPSVNGDFFNDGALVYKKKK